MKFERIEQLRLERGFTIRFVASYLGCNRDVYSRYEKGGRQIPIDLAVRLARLYDCSMDYLLGLSDIRHHYGE
ncbi:MAG: helix-turn-helix transcriptional regulator [Fusicatenibacter sp.]|nr:helix-turn-helix transcriptional regulator [Lachnospiraceae bacterium]MDY2937051.1 helix-turn-helix transcriptional regulator [Fusicatenibacter sp.]